MIYDIGDRQTGKTQRCIEWLDGHPNRILVCHSDLEAARVFLICEEEERDIQRRQLVTANTDLRGRDRFEAVIDDIDLVGKMKFPHLWIVGATATGKAGRITP